MSADGVPFSPGEDVRITYADQVVLGVVLLASGPSLMLAFDALLGDPTGGAYMGLMPVLRDDAGIWRDLVLGEPVTIERVAPGPVTVH